MCTDDRGASSGVPVTTHLRLSVGTSGMVRICLSRSASRVHQAEVRDRLARLQQEHARKPTLIERLKAAGLLAE